MAWTRMKFRVGAEVSSDPPTVLIIRKHDLEKFLKLCQWLVVELLP